MENATVEAPQLENLTAWSRILDHVTKLDPLYRRPDRRRLLEDEVGWTCPGKGNKS